MSGSACLMPFLNARFMEKIVCHTPLSGLKRQKNSWLKPVQRPDTLRGRTYKASLDNGKPLYVTVNEQDGRVVEVFVRLDEPEAFEWVTALTVLITRLLRAGEPLEAIAQDLQQVHSPRTAHWVKGVLVPSLPARIGVVLERHLASEASHEIHL